MPAALPPLDPAVLPAGVRSSYLHGINGLDVHILEAGDQGTPLPAAAARVSRTRLFLAQHHGAAG